MSSGGRHPLHGSARVEKASGAGSLWLDAADAVVAAVTTASPRSPFDVLLADWQASGLRAPSTLRLSRLDCVEQTLLIHRLGALSPGDTQAVKAAWAQHVKPQF